MDFYDFHTPILGLDDFHGNAVDAQADPDFRDIPQMFKDQAVECLGAVDGQVERQQPIDITQIVSSIDECNAFVIPA